jgi:predicted ATPase
VGGRDWPASIPAVAQVLRDGLDMSAGVTLLVGENGSGKSTLVEAVAMAFGLAPEGGTRNVQEGTRATESPLHSWIRLERAPGAPRWGFFLRAETMHGYFTLPAEAPGRPQLLTASAIWRAAWPGVRCVVSTTSASSCSHVRAASA